MKVLWFDCFLILDWGKEARIERAGMDGQHRIVIARGPHVMWPNGIALDLLEKRVYWADAKVCRLGFLCIRLGEIHLLDRLLGSRSSRCSQVAQLSASSILHCRLRGARLLHRFCLRRDDTRFRLGARWSDDCEQVQWRGCSKGMH